MLSQLDIVHHLKGKKSQRQKKAVCLSAVAPLSCIPKNNTKTVGPSRGTMSSPLPGPRCPPCPNVPEPTSTRLDSTSSPPMQNQSPTHANATYPPTFHAHHHTQSHQHQLQHKHPWHDGPIGTAGLRRETLAATNPPTYLAEKLACPHPGALPPSACIACPCFLCVQCVVCPACRRVDAGTRRRSRRSPPCVRVCHVLLACFFSPWGGRR
ncbi:hypothetical protein B0T18DRAFT_7617 [Schizothecium vesticola]|uniref:Uncharacterized protein n=1 Tax=Schizothecium vesticola TaxID=314040 RepID=A0AA40F8U6_9PEZI|nr:hypothetical protein B0T18DRAFT_7617 [Schizothecium vesticola]